MGVKVAFLEEGTDVDQAPRPVPGVLVPRSAVAGSGTGSRVWVVLTDTSGDALVERRGVVMGKTEGSRVRITDGLSAGERVVKAVNDALEEELRDGTRVSVVD